MPKIKNSLDTVRLDIEGFDCGKRERRLLSAHQWLNDSDDSNIRPRGGGEWIKKNNKV